MQVVLDARGLSRSYGPDVVLDGVDLTINTAERVGLVGLNGSGKSTLARILAGIEQPDAGAVTRWREATVAYLPQTATEIDPSHTALQEVLEGMGAWTAAVRRHERACAALDQGAGEMERLLQEQSAAAAEVERLGGWDQRHRALELLGHLDLRDPHTRLGTMSGGEQRRVALCRILVSRPTLAILDEPTNHLDLDTIEWLERHLMDDFPGALLLITHDRYVLDRVVRRTLELHGGQLHAYEGGYEAYLEAKTRRMGLEARTEANRQGFLRRELEWLRRQPKARTGKQKARSQRAERALQVEAPRQQRQAQLRLESARSSKWLLELSDLRLELGGRTLVQGLDFLLTRGQRVGIVGPNGCGKTTLLRAILGQLPPTAGQVRLSGTARPTYLSQVRDGLDEGKSVLENVAGKGRHVAVGGQTMEVHAYLERFLFRGDDRLRQPLSTLSGGERTRVALARVLQGEANLVVLDEPTNDLDVSTLAALEQLLLEFEGTALVVTHDRWFLDRVATALLVFEGEGRVVHYAGNYTLMQTLRRQRNERQRESEAPPAVQGPRRPPRKPRSLTYGERLELQSLEEQIEVADRLVAGLEAQLGDPSMYHKAAGVADAARLSVELEQARAEVERLMQRWEELETKRLAEE